MNVRVITPIDFCASLVPVRQRDHRADTPAPHEARVTVRPSARAVMRYPAGGDHAIRPATIGDSASGNSNLADDVWRS